MAKKPQISTNTFNQALQNEAVLKALANKSSLMLPRVQQLAAKSGRLRLAKAVRIEAGTRPGTKSEQGIKRPYVRVIAQYTEEDRKADRGAALGAREIFRRASR